MSLTYIVNSNEDIKSLKEANVTIGFKSDTKCDPTQDKFGLNINSVNEFSNILILDDPFTDHTNIFDGIN